MHRLLHLLLPVLFYFSGSFVEAQTPPSIVKDLKFGAGDGITRTSLTAQIGSTVYFVGSDVGDDEFLFKTNGSNAGTVKVHPSIKNVVGMAVAGDLLIFEATQNGRGIFKTDGTQAGTVKLADFSTDDIYYLYSFSDDRAIFGVKTNGVSQMWMTDGTQAGTFSLGNWEVDDAYASFTWFQGKMIITDRFNPDPLPVIATDGTVAGTYYLDSTLLALTGLADIYHCAGADDLLFVSGKNVLPNGTYNGKTFVTDGTVAGTHEIGTFGTVDKALKVNNLYYLFFNADVYVYNATDHTLLQILDGEAHIYAQPVAFYDKAYISGVDGEIYESDGTVEGTQVISTLGTGVANYHLSMWEFDHMLYYHFRSPEQEVGINRIDLFTRTESLFFQFSEYSNVVRVPVMHRVECKFIFPRHTAAQGFEWWGTASVPGPPLVVIGDSTTLCTSQPVPLQVVNVCDGCTVNWTGGQTGPSIQTSQSGNYFCSMSNACGASPWSNVINIATGPPAAPTVIALGDTILCTGDSILLLSGNMCSGCVPVWSTGQTGSPIWVSSPGNYSVTLANACGTSAPSETQMILTSSPPVILLDDACNLTAPAGSNYQWYLDDLAIDGATGLTYVAAATGLYSVSMTSPGGCPGTSEPVFANCLVSTQENQPFPSVSVFPNPVENGVLHIRLEWTTEEGSMLLHLFNSVGQLVRTAVLPESPDMEMDLQYVPPGAYLLKAQGEGRSFQKMVLVQ